MMNLGFRVTASSSTVLLIRDSKCVAIARLRPSGQCSSLAHLASEEPGMAYMR